MSTQTLDDETLMAYADGALSDRDQKWVASQIGSDPAAQRLVTMFRSTSALARLAFDGPMTAAPPPQIVALINRPPRREMVNGWALPWPLTPILSDWRAMLLPVAAAATLAFTVSQLTGWSRWPWSGADNFDVAHVALGKVEPRSTLARTLDGFHVRLPAPVDSRFVLVATMTDKWGNPCQEVDVNATLSSTTPDVVLVACRVSNGTWTVVGAVTPRMQTQTAFQEPYVASPTAAHDALASVLSMIGARQRASALKPESPNQ